MGRGLRLRAEQDSPRLPSEGVKMAAWLPRQPLPLCASLPVLAPPDQARIEPRGPRGQATSIHAARGPASPGAGTPRTPACPGVGLGLGLGSDGE